MGGVQEGVSHREIDWLLIGRYALLIGLTALIPIPLVDTGVENWLRRRMVRSLAERHNVTLDDEAVATLGNAATGGCFGCVWSVLLWPIRKIVKTLLFVFQVKTIADTASELVHRGLMLEEAIELGWLPGDADRVRLAMDRALVHIDTRLVERKLRGVFQDHTNDLNRAIHSATVIAREQVLADPKRALADAIEADNLGSGAQEMTQAMTASIQGLGTVPELLQWFRVEMGQNVAPLEISGTLEPEVLDVEQASLSVPPAGPEVEDALEVRPAERITEEE